MDTVTAAEVRPWFRRPHFREGQLLTAHALNVQQADGIDRLRLLVRAMFGQGVVFGYALQEIADKYISVTCGLALDRHGRELVWPGGRVCISDLVGDLPSEDGDYTLAVHYAERHTGRDLPSYCEKDDIDWIEQGVVFSLTQSCEAIDCCACPELQTEGCFDLCDYICARTGSVTGHVATAPDLDHACKRPVRLCPTSRPGWTYDPCAGIPLARIKISLTPSEASDCAPPFTFSEEGAVVCEARPFAYRNPLLFELIKGCHLSLACVQNLSWNDWFARGWDGMVSWQEFQNRLTGGGDLIIEFSRKMRVDTLNPASIRLTARTQEWRADYWKTDGIPFEIEFPEKSEGFASQAKLVIDSDWIQAEVSGGRSSLFHGALIELTIRGALIRDDCGRVLDARPLDISEDTCAPAMPGGDFVAFFRLAQRPEHGDYQSAAPQSSHTSASE